MSLLLMIFYWVILPYGFFWLTKMLFQRTQSLQVKIWVVAGAVGVFAWLFWIAVGEQMWIDQQVREMCAKDGGVRIYETVELTPDLIDKAGRIWIPAKEKATPSDKYYYEIKEYFFRKGNPQMSRRQTRIIKQSDGKVLGEDISYSRIGGDLPGPWHESSFTCPDINKGLKFESAIFIKGNNK